jgi:hypothetical protein
MLRVENSPLWQQAQQLKSIRQALLTWNNQMVSQMTLDQPLCSTSFKHVFTPGPPSGFFFGNCGWGPDFEMALRNASTHSR